MQGYSFLLYIVTGLMSMKSVCGLVWLKLGLSEFSELTPDKSISLKLSGSFRLWFSHSKLTLTEASTLLLYAKETTQAVNGFHAYRCIAGALFFEPCYFWVFSVKIGEWKKWNKKILLQTHKLWLTFMSRHGTLHLSLLNYFR